MWHVTEPTGVVHITAQELCLLEGAFATCALLQHGKGIFLIIGADEDAAVHWQQDTGHAC